MKHLITKELMKRLESESGGFSKEVLELLGIGWPPTQGWKKALQRRIEGGDKIYTKDAPLPEKQLGFGL